MSEQKEKITGPIKGKYAKAFAAQRYPGKKVLQTQEALLYLMDLAYQAAEKAKENDKNPENKDKRVEDYLKPIVMPYNTVLISEQPASKTKPAKTPPRRFDGPLTDLNRKEYTQEEIKNLKPFDVSYGKGNKNGTGAYVKTTINEDYYISLYNENREKVIILENYKNQEEFSKYEKWDAKTFLGEEKKQKTPEQLLKTEQTNQKRLETNEHKLNLLCFPRLDQKALVDENGKGIPLAELYEAHANGTIDKFISKQYYDVRTFALGAAEEEGYEFALVFLD